MSQLFNPSYRITTVPNVSGLSSVLPNPADGQLVQTLGYNTQGDTGDNIYEYVASHSGTPNGGTILPGLGGTMSLDSAGLFDGTEGTGRYIAASAPRVTQWGDSLLAAAAALETLEINKVLSINSTAEISGVALEFTNGGMISVASGQVLTATDCSISGDSVEIVNGDFLLRDSTSPARMSQRQTTLNPAWFPGGDIGEKINNAFACGGKASHVYVNPGDYELTTTIDMTGSHFVLEGAGFIGTTLTMTSVNPMLGIEMQAADECTLRNIRIIEFSGSRVSACVAVGGTSSRLSDVWVGNAKYGILYNGAGASIANCYGEFCTEILHISSRFFDSSIPGLDNTGVKNARSVDISDLVTYDSIITIQNYLHMSITESTGSVQAGDIITGSTSGASVEVLDRIGDTILISRADINGSFAAPEPYTATGGSNTGTILGFNGNAIQRIRLSGMHYGRVAAASTVSGYAIRINDAKAVQLNMDIHDFPEGGIDIESVEGLNAVLSAQNCGEPSAIRIKDTEGVALITTGNADVVNSPHYKGLDVIDSNLVISGRSNQEVALGYGDELVTENTFPLVKFDGVDDFVSSDIGTSYFTGNTNIRVKFRVYGEVTQNGVIATHGQNDSNCWQITSRIFSTYEAVRVELKIADSITAVETTYMTGEYDVLMNTSTGAITITRPDGVALSNSLTGEVFAIRADGNLYLGKRPSLNDRFCQMILSDVRLYDNSDTLVHEFKGRGAWSDPVGGATTNTTGSPETTYGFYQGEEPNVISYIQELSVDPPNPPEGESVIWQSDGTGSGDDGDLMAKITAGGLTKIVTIVDFSAS